MRIAALALAVACGSAQQQSAPLPPLPDGPSCERAYVAIERSLAELHTQAGKPMPVLPDRASWIRTCEGLGWTPQQLGCLEPEVAATEAARCVQALEGLDRTPIDQPFLSTLLEQEPK